MNKTDLPNPLQINFGDGKILVSFFEDGGSAGIAFWQVDEQHEIGEYAPPIPNPHRPQDGEVYLAFTNTASLNVVLGALYGAHTLLSLREEDATIANHKS